MASRTAGHRGKEHYVSAPTDEGHLAATDRLRLSTAVGRQPAGISPPPGIAIDARRLERGVVVQSDH
jgi:hypothetical protein